MIVTLVGKIVKKKSPTESSEMKICGKPFFKKLKALYKKQM